MELIQLRLTAGISHDSPVLPENAKVEALNNREDDEGGLTTGRWKLFQVPEQHHVDGSEGVRLDRCIRATAMVYV